MGGIPEVVEDGCTGFLHSPDDVDGFAGSMTKLLANPTLASDMGRAGRERAVARFSLERMVEEYRVLYDGLLKDTGRK